MGGLLEGLAELAGEEMPDLSISGYGWATNAPNGSSVLFMLILAVGGAAALHRRGVYLGLGILAGLSLLAGPMPQNDAASFSYGFFLTIIGILAMMVSGVICLEAD